MIHVRVVLFIFWDFQSLLNLWLDVIHDFGEVNTEVPGTSLRHTATPTAHISSMAETTRSLSALYSEKLANS